MKFTVTRTLHNTWLLQIECSGIKEPYIEAFLFTTYEDVWDIMVAKMRIEERM